MILVAFLCARFKRAMTGAMLGMAILFTLGILICGAGSMATESYFLFVVWAVSWDLYLEVWSSVRSVTWPFVVTTL